MLDTAQAAIAAGMRTLLEDGKLKVLQGITTIEEVARHAQASTTMQDFDAEE